MTKTHQKKPSDARNPGAERIESALALDSPATGVAVPELADRRRDYRRDGLVEENAQSDPFAQFSLWLADAVASCEGTPEEPHAMSIATVDELHAPAIRTVLLKGFDSRGFVWFTNYESRKGQNLGTNANAALNFRWSQLERQVTARGVVSRVEPNESDAYFHSRPRGSRVGAIVSPQSRVISNRSVLEDAVAAIADAPDEALLRPAHWGGFRLNPSEIEFWQGRPSRLHDRLRYRLVDGAWIRERLAP